MSLPRQPKSHSHHMHCCCFPRQLSVFMHRNLSESVVPPVRSSGGCQSPPSLVLSSPRFVISSLSRFAIKVIDDAQDGLSKQFRVALGASRMDDPRNSLGSPGLSTSSAGANSNSAYGHSASASATWYRKGVRDGALRGFLQEAYHLFCLFYGPLPQLIRAIGVRTARRCLAAFLPDFLTGQPQSCFCRPEKQGCHLCPGCSTLWSHFWLKKQLQ